MVRPKNAMARIIKRRIARHPNFAASEKLDDDFIAQLEEAHEVTLPRYCRLIIRAALAAEIGDREIDAIEIKNYRTILQPLSQLLNALRAQGGDKATAAFVHTNDIVERFWPRRAGVAMAILREVRSRQQQSRARRRKSSDLDGLEAWLEQKLLEFESKKRSRGPTPQIEALMLGLDGIVREFAQLLPTPGGKERGVGWLRRLQLESGVPSTPKKQGRQSVDRSKLYSQLAFVWRECGMVVAGEPGLRYSDTCHIVSWSECNCRGWIAS